jgi:hypothetical protein
MRGGDVGRRPYRGAIGKEARMDGIATTSESRRSTGSGTLVRLGWGRWRVLTRSGDVAGLIEERATSQGIRFRALRYRWNDRAFVEVGEFWRLDDAATVLRSA